MNNLKFLQIPIALILSILACAVFMGCAGNRAVRSPSAAEKIAVNLANDSCELKFGKRPFRTGAFPATRSGDRWLWGWLDPARCEGFSAQVSFKADRTGAHVDVNHVGESQVDYEEPDAPSPHRNRDPGPLSQQVETAPLPP